MSEGEINLHTKCAQGRCDGKPIIIESDRIRTSGFDIGNVFLREKGIILLKAIFKLCIPKEVIVPIVVVTPNTHIVDSRCIHLILNIFKVLGGR